MSSIAGLFYLDGRSVDHRALAEMIGSMAHRGPDDTGIWHSGSVGLGHGMLHTTPESLHEHQPLVAKSAEVVLTADARIDNRDELISLLDLADPSPRQITDSELILSAYCRWGERCPEKLIGDFAFAIWDGRERRIFCARDHMGARSLYYFHRQGCAFAFASEIKALLCLAEVLPRLNEVAVGDFLSTNFEDTQITFYCDIYRLPPAHSMTIDHDGIQRRSYWSLDASAEVRLSSDDEYAEALREILMEAVRCRLRSAFPVGAMLSGGLDSSSIVALAGKHLAETGGNKPHTFSAVFPSVAQEDPRIDETRYMQSVLEAGDGRYEPHFVRADLRGPLEEVLWFTDEPLGVTTLYLDRAIFRAAQQEGVRVLLSGFDGDTAISYGYEFLAELARQGRWDRFAHEADLLRGNMNVPPLWLLHYLGFEHLERLVRDRRWARFAKEVNSIAKQFDVSRRDLLRKHRLWQMFVDRGLKPLAPDVVRQTWRVLHGRPRQHWPLDRAINPAFARRIGLPERVHRLHDNGTMPPQTARAGHRTAIYSGLIRQGVEILAITAAASSVDLSYPFFDKRLLEFSLAVPPEQKIQSGWTRMILRRAMDGILPQEVLWRADKGNLSANFHRGFKEEVGLVEEVMADLERIAEYVDPQVVREAYQRYQQEPTRNVQAVMLVFRIVNLAVWLKHVGALS